MHLIGNVVFRRAAEAFDDMLLIGVISFEWFLANPSRLKHRSRSRTQPSACAVKYSNNEIRLAKGTVELNGTAEIIIYRFGIGALFTPFCSSHSLSNSCPVMDTPRNQCFWRSLPDRPRSSPVWNIC